MSRQPDHELDPIQFPLGSIERRKELDRLRKHKSRAKHFPRGRRLAKRQCLVGICRVCGCNFRSWSHQATTCSERCAGLKKKGVAACREPFNRSTDPEVVGCYIDQHLLGPKAKKARPQRERLPDDYPMPPWVERGNGSWVDLWWVVGQLKKVDSARWAKACLPGQPQTWFFAAPSVMVKGKYVRLKTPELVNKYRAYQSQLAEVLPPKPKRKPSQAVLGPMHALPGVEIFG